MFDYVLLLFFSFFDMFGCFENMFLYCWCVCIINCYFWLLIGFGVVFCIYQDIFKAFLEIFWKMSQKCEQFPYELFLWFCMICLDCWPLSHIPIRSMSKFPSGGRNMNEKKYDFYEKMKMILKWLRRVAFVGWDVALLESARLLEFASIVSWVTSPCYSYLWYQALPIPVPSAGPYQKVLPDARCYVLSEPQGCFGMFLGSVWHLLAPFCNLLVPFWHHFVILLHPCCSF